MTHSFLPPEDRAEWRVWLGQKLGPDAGRDARLDAIDAELDRPTAEADLAAARAAQRAVDQIQREYLDPYSEGPLPDGVDVRVIPIAHSEVPEDAR
jgi:hypothetical protein